MQPHEIRVMEEKMELDSKLGKLFSFCFGIDNSVYMGLHPKDRELLMMQYNIMQKYSEILSQRILRFGGNNEE